MSKDQSDDDQVQRFLWEAEDGLTAPREDSPGNATSNPSRPQGGPTAYDKLVRSRRGGNNTMERWFVPVSAMILATFVVGIIVTLSRGDDLNALENEVTALKEQTQELGTSDDIRTDLDQLDARVEGITTRLSSAQDVSADIQALQSQVAEQNAALETLTARVGELEQASSASSATGSGSSSSTASTSTQSSGQTGSGTWVINLITVADRASAEQFQERLNGMNIESRIEAVTRDGKTLQRVLVPGYGSQDEARSAVPELKSRLGLSDDPWIARE